MRWPGGCGSTKRSAPPAHVAESFEVGSLKELVLADLSRFRRRTPTDFSYRRLLLPGHAGPTATVIKSDSALGRHLLAKSIDRLESILFISPDDAEAACALGFCYSMHPDKIYRPDWADELLRKAYSLDPQGQVAAIALGFLAEVDYNDHSGEMAPDRDAGAAIERIWFAFEHMPEKYRDWHWPRLPGVIGELGRDPSQAQALADVMTRVAPYAEYADERNRTLLATTVMGMAVELIRSSGQPDLEAKGKALLEALVPRKQPAAGQPGPARVGAGGDAPGESPGGGGRLPGIGAEGRRSGSAGPGTIATCN